MSTIKVRNKQMKPLTKALGDSFGMLNGMVSMYVCLCLCAREKERVCVFVTRNGSSVFKRFFYVK